MKFGWSLFLESVRMSTDSVKRNKLRSLLSVLGITIGIFCIVSVYALVHSLELSLNNRFSKMGTQVLFIQKWPWDDMGNDYPWWKFLKRPVSSVQEAEFLQRKLSKQKVSNLAYVFQSNLNVSANKQVLNNISIKFVSHEFDKVQDVSISDGRYFTEQESSAGRNVCLLGYSIAQNLFPAGNSIGNEIRLGNQLVTVIGVCEQQGSSIVGQSNDDILIAPVKLGLNIASYRNSEDAQILVKAQNGVDLDELRFELNRLMRQVRKLPPHTEDDFAVNKMSMITDAISGLFSQIQKIGLVIGAFAMIVGSFGVANIMFVSVKERTREIGIQKALGATNGFIRAQFLLESVWLSIAGGAIGLLWVSGLLKILDAFAKSGMGADVVLALNLEDALLGVISSVFVGLVAGYLPAQTAAKLSPVEAIRSN